MYCKCKTNTHVYNNTVEQAVMFSISLFIFAHCFIHSDNVYYFLLNNKIDNIQPPHH